jgi:4-hydroxybenzoyl-CoA reductase alpha subunit
MDHNNSLIGKPLPKVDSLAKCFGTTKFTDDLVLPRMVYGKILRAIHPHAHIVRVDTSEALARPGVLAAITGADLPIKYGIMPTSQDETALAVDKVRHVGEAVAAVAALDEEIAEAALEDIVVDYEVLPPVMSIEDALSAQVRIHEESKWGNAHKEVALEFGDTTAGFAQADYIREDSFFYEGSTHLPIEQHAVVADFSPDGKLTLWSSTQTPHYVHRALSRVLELPMSHVRVIAPPVGGGFGGKSDPFPHEFCAAKLAMLTGRPVKITLTREEVFYCHRGRHPVKMWVKTGFRKDGSITAVHFRSFLDGGAYSSYGLASTYYTGALQTTTYQLPHYKFEGVRLFTNKPPCGPKRGHGTPQPRYAMEIQLDKAAEALGLDPLEMRLGMLTPANSEMINGLKITSTGLWECIEKVRDQSGWKKKFRQLPPGRGVGFALSCYITGAGLPIYWNDMPHSSVQIRLDRGGGVAVFCGAIDIGQGSDSVLTTVVAEELGIDPADIRLVTADTDLTPVDLGSYSSRVTLMMGNAAVEAAQQLRNILFTVAAERLGCPEQDLIARGGKIFSSKDPERVLSFAEAVQLAETHFGTLGAVGSYKPPKLAAPYKGSGVGPSPAYSFSACVAEVECDPTTGLVNPVKIWLAHDCGRAINPLLVQGQVEGSVYMALGEVLMEEQVFRRGLHKIPSLLDYKSPTTLETPEIETILVESMDSRGPYGAKEAGQGPLLPVPPALANAVYDALGVRIDEIPITPDKVLKALALKERGDSLRVQVPQFTFPAPIRWQPGEREKRS